MSDKDAGTCAGTSAYGGTDTAYVSECFGKEWMAAEAILPQDDTKKQVHYIASDAHDQVHRKPDLLPCAEYVSKKYGQQMAEQIFIKNPAKIIKKSKKMQDKRRNQ